jgi:hypothetical protein
MYRWRDHADGGWRQHGAVTAAPRASGGQHGLRSGGPRPPPARPAAGGGAGACRPPSGGRCQHPGSASTPPRGARPGARAPLTWHPPAPRVAPPRCPHPPWPCRSLAGAAASGAGSAVAAGRSQPHAGGHRRHPGNCGAARVCAALHAVHAVRRHRDAGQRPGAAPAAPHPPPHASAATLAIRLACGGSSCRHPQPAAAARGAPSPPAPRVAGGTAPQARPALPARPPTPPPRCPLAPARYGKIFRLSFGPKSFVVISDPAYARQILQTNADKYSKGLLRCAAAAPPPHPRLADQPAPAFAWPAPWQPQHGTGAAMRPAPGHI